MLVLPHEIAGRKPHVAGCKDIAQNFFLRLRLAGITLETAARGRPCLGYPADRVSGLIGCVANAESLVVAHGIARFDVDLDQLNGKAVREKGGHPPDRTGLALRVEQRKAPFGRSVEF